MLVDRIYEQYEKRNAEPPRAHLGASVVGGICERASWYHFRWATRSSFTGRMLRLFESGHLQEKRLIADLESIGVKVITHDSSTGKAFHASDLHGHFSGSLDGIAIIDGKRYVLEFKTHNDRSFNELLKKGMKETKPQHYTQVQSYMGLFKIHQALYLAVNKNTDEIYEEFVEFDEAVFRGIIHKATRIITTNVIPEKISTNEAFYKCKMCEHKGVCHKAEEMLKHCRSCVFSGAAREGVWKCTKKNIPLDVQAQMQGCGEYQPIAGNV